jgi:hypothetical protein
MGTRAEGQTASGARDVSRDVSPSVSGDVSRDLSRALSLGLMATYVVTRVDPAYRTQTFTEGYLTQPAFTLDASSGSWRWQSTVNFEGYTLRRGELNPGMYGEGYVDRRHPHTLVHEAMLTVSSTARRVVRLSLAAGKGFTPYGSDDPMMRPFVTYPVNHHHAQIIERAQVVGAIAIGNGVRRLSLEHGVFNGDEPYAPFSAPRWSRVGDSHATRLTVRPTGVVEWQVSRAFVKSPGLVQGGAFDHAQTSTSLRVDGTDARGDHRTLLAEFARTDEQLGQRRAFRFESVLIEGDVQRRGWQLALRAERTERPENERLLDPFRMQAGHVDFQIIGVTRWQVLTARLGAPALPFAPQRAVQLRPFVEVALSHADARRRPALFDPQTFYGASTLTSINVGAQLHIGPMRHRMGRYGVMDTPTTGHMGHDGAHRGMNE